MDFWLCVTLIAVLTYLVFTAHKKRHYFAKYGIPQPPEIPFIGAAGASILTGYHVNYAMKDVYNTNRDAKYVGIHAFIYPIIVLRDLDLIKSVIVKNFDHFSDHKTLVSEKSDPLFGKNLANLKGERWREVRNLLSPAFSSSKMRTMHELMSLCAENFANRFLESNSSKEAVDMKDAFTRYTNDVIASCAFGIEVDSLKESKNEFYLHGKTSTDFTKPSVLVCFLLNMVCPSLANKLGLRIVSQEETDYFVKLIKETIKTREERGIKRPDMLQLLLDSQEKTKKLDFLDLTAQAFIFFAAGFDTVSTHACCMAHELAVNPDVQRKLRVEIDEVMRNCKGRPTYEAVNNMRYLDAIFHETMRIHPIAFITRICTKEFELPPTLPGAEPYVLKPGMEVQVPTVGIHHDPDYYDDPEKFDPERFMDKKASSDILNLGFGLGPRMCIGNRFAILETKVLFVHLLAKCDLVPCEKTCNPMVYADRSFIPAAKGGFWLKAVPRH
ncbi:cytochrome P450 9e2 [Nasonia vitripennis]|uniref:Cytochrome P450 n=1 Tax=Nasonia vitripennis TaxID=7425 RepID=A0A7M7GBN1_NASVI|nr:cytochrome P450 9e2 [Nasonia vitripennis]